MTGQLVFSAGTVMGTIMHHARTPPTPPSQRSELAFPPDLDALVMACLAKDPAERPQSAGELSRRSQGSPVDRIGATSGRASGGVPTIR